MPGQPDWQRYQSSTGPILWSVTNSGPTTSATMPVGPWRSWYMRATITGGTGLWAVDTKFTEDPAGTVVVSTNRTVIGNSVFRLGWLPVVAPYVTFTLTLLVASATDKITVFVVPSLLDPPQASRTITTPYVSLLEFNQSAGTFSDHDATFIMPGPARLEVRANMMPVFWDVQQLSDAGVWVVTDRYQPGQINVAQQWDILMPDRPVRVTVNAISKFAVITFDLSLSPT